MLHFCDLLWGNMDGGEGGGGWRCCIPVTSGRSSDVIFL